MMFSHNLNEVLTIFVALLIGWPLPLLPLQAFAIAFRPLARILGFAPVGDAGAAVFAIAVITPVMVVEIQKAIARGMLTTIPRRKDGAKPPGAAGG